MTITCPSPRPASLHVGHRWCYMSRVMVMHILWKLPGVSVRHHTVCTPEGYHTSTHSMQSVHMTRGQSSHSISPPLCEFCRQINLCIWRLKLKKKCKHVTLRRTATDLRLAVIYTVWSRAFEIQFIVENKTSFAQTWAIRVLERSIFTDTGTRWRAWEDRCDLRGFPFAEYIHFCYAECYLLSRF